MADSLNPTASSKKGLIDVQPVQGCRDFPPEDMRVRRYLFDSFHSVARSFGFEEYDAPMLEAEDLYVRKGGEEITQQMFNFTTKGGHRVALRPEMTPTLARLILAKGRSLLLPVKWYSLPQCWRYEAITRGRRREHYQWNMDIIGAKGVGAEVELVAAMCTAMESLGLTAKDVVVKVNSRKLLQCVLEGAGVEPSRFVEVCIIVDKLDKLPPEEVRAQLVAKDLSPSAIDAITSTLSAQNIDDVARVVGADHEAVREVRQFMELIDNYGLGEWIRYDASVVRGLAYYTGIVFEACDRGGKFRAICGGGRYDQLLTTFGSPQPIPCCGFGFGDCVIAELLQDKKLIPALPHCVDDVVIPFDESMRPKALQVLRRLRQGGRVADIVLDKKKMTQAFSYADRVGARRAILVAPDEWEQGNVRVKMLREGAGREGGERGEAVPLAALIPARNTQDAVN